MLREIKKAKLNSKEAFQLEIYQWARFVFIASFSMAMLMIINASITASKINGNFHLTVFGPFLWLRLLLFTLVLYRIIFSKRLLCGLQNFRKDSEIITKQLATTDSNIQTEIDQVQEVSKEIILSDQQAKQYHLVLVQFFLTQTHLYTELEFNLNHLAKFTNIPKHHWAYYFQYHSEISFVELRNKNRITFAKNIMRLPAFRNRTIEAIGSASGFGSRVTFFNAFKKYESITPSEYWDSIKRDTLD